MNRSITPSLGLMLVCALPAAADAGYQIQGYQIQGYDLQGFSIGGKEVVVSFPYAGMRYRGRPLSRVRVERGGLVGELRYPLRDRSSLGRCERPTGGLRRNCGWKLAAVGSCRPRAPVVVGAARGCRLGHSSGNAMLRICSGGWRSCNHGPKVGWRARHGMLAASDDSRCGGTSPRATFTCPASGRFLVLAANYQSNGPLQARLRARGATLNRTYLSGPDFAGVHLTGNLDTGGALGQVLEFRIRTVRAENHKYEPGTLPPRASGWTWLYSLQYRDRQSRRWRAACSKDADGRAAAIPLASVWKRNGRRSTSPERFSLSCTTGVVGKCYRWGYRPWYVAQPGNPRLLSRVHWTCTRMARADYCGDGVSRTQNGTSVFVWDSLRPPVQTPLSQIPTTMTFESGWSTCGAVCLSHFRWKNRPPVCPPTTSCLYRVVAGAAAGTPVPNKCDTQKEAEDLAKTLKREVRVFNLSNLNAPPVPVPAKR